MGSGALPRSSCSDRRRRPYKAFFATHQPKKTEDGVCDTNDSSPRLARFAQKKCISAHALRVWRIGCAMDNQAPLPLPFEYRLLVPFINAWRAASSELPLPHRAARVSDILKEWGYSLSTESIAAIVEDYGEILRLNAPSPPPPSSRQLVPADKVCCVCEGELVSFIHGSRTLKQIPGRSTVTLWSLSAAPQPCVLVDKECTVCGTLHQYNSVTTARCLAVLRVPNPTKDSGKPMEAVLVRSALKRELGVLTRYAEVRPGAPVLSLMRGFDKAPLHFMGTLDDSDAIVTWVRQRMPHASTEGARENLSANDRRYRTDVLELPFFLPATDPTVGQHAQIALETELLAMATALMERTQVAFRGLVDSLMVFSAHMGRKVQRLSHVRLADAFFERELLVLCRHAQLPLPPPDAFRRQHATREGDGHNRRGDDLWERALPRLLANFREVWAKQHEEHCTRRGDCRLLVMDGNAKLWRRTCSQRFRFYDILVRSRPAHSSFFLPVRPRLGLTCMHARPHCTAWLRVGAPWMHEAAGARHARLRRVSGFLRITCLRSMRPGGVVRGRG